MVADFACKKHACLVDLFSRFATSVGKFATPVGNPNGSDRVIAAQARTVSCEPLLGVEVGTENDSWTPACLSSAASSFNESVGSLNAECAVGRTAVISSI